MVEFLYLIGGTRCKMSNSVELHVKVMDFSWDHEFKVLRGGVFPVILSLNLLRLIPILFFNCSVEDGGVASAGISGQDEGFMDESMTVDSPEPLKVLNQVPLKTSATGKGTVKRKYHDSYLDIGFVETIDNKPQCVICGKICQTVQCSQRKFAVILRGSIQTGRTNRVISSE